LDQIDAFVSDFPKAEQRAIALDEKIMTASQKISNKYTNLVSMAIRQTIAGIDITVRGNGKGGWNQSDIKAFMKDTGSTTCVPRANY
jgi:hypothetical protein